MHVWFGWSLQMDIFKRFEFMYPRWKRKAEMGDLLLKWNLIVNLIYKYITLISSKAIDPLLTHFVKVLKYQRLVFAMTLFHLVVTSYHLKNFKYWQVYPRLDSKNSFWDNHIPWVTAKSFTRGTSNQIKLP